jgi:radical SAM protein with 4Fe4S-binding SPASM domain
MPKTACIIPWTNLVVTPDGQARFCCEIPRGLTVNGRTGNIYRNSVDELWNGDEIVETRAAMARGERPKSCRACWKREAAGGVSRRQLINEVYTQIGGELDVEALPQVGAASG